MKWDSERYIPSILCTWSQIFISSFQTVQSISLLAYLAETHDIWGPFLVVAPASTLHNWQQEITRFVPRLKALPYWGNAKDRTTLRKFWSKKEISYDQDAPFHVLITSYQLVRKKLHIYLGVADFFLSRSPKINSTSRESGGNTWSLMRPRTSKTLPVSAGKRFLDSTVEIVCF